MNRPQLIEEITSGGFKQYKEAGLIDEQSLNRWIRIELSRFGSNIMVGNEKTLRVENGRAKLPENFWKLDLALQVDLTTIHGEGDQEDFLQSRLFYKERREVDVIWDNASESFQHKNFKCITEDIYLTNYSIRACYSNERFLRLTKGHNKEKVSDKCHTLSKLYTNSANNEISIKGDYIYTNFDSGWIYIQFSGLETDEEGEFVIPACNNNRVSEYLINYCRMRTLKEILLGDDDPNKINMLKMLIEDTQNSLKEAFIDSAWHGAQGWKRGMKKARYDAMSKYDKMLVNR